MQANLKVYNSPGMNDIRSFVFYDHVHNEATQALCFNVTDKEGSVLLSCADTFVPGSVLARDKLDIMILSDAKQVISQDDKSYLFTNDQEGPRQQC